MRKLLFICTCLLYMSMCFSQKNNELLFCQKNILLPDTVVNEMVEKNSNTQYDITYHRVYWVVDPAKRYISGKVTSYFKANNTDITSIAFDLSDSLIVDSITSISGIHQFIHTDNSVQIQLDRTVKSGRLDSLTIFYHGKPSIHSNSFYNSLHDSVPILWTLSEPYGAPDWWPCKQSLSDKIDSIDIYVESLPAYKVASNGVLMFESQTNNKKITFWKHRYPIAVYSVAIAITNYDVFSHYAQLSSGDSVEILNYVYPEDRNMAEDATKYTVDVLKLFSNLFIPYPFRKEKYGHAQFDWGGGMEHQTMSFMGGFSRGLIVHELAHQWFGNHTTCSNWQDIWVNEGFATYCEGLAIENLHPDDWLNWKKNKIQRILLRCDNGSVAVDDTNDIHRLFDFHLTYLKGGMLLHTLRGQIGDSAFFNAIRMLLADKKHANGFASAKDVKNLFEHCSNSDLTVFFENWYYGQGYPKYTIEVEHNSVDSVILVVSQSTTHQSVPFFPLTIPILLKGKRKSKKLRLDHHENKQRFNISVGFKIHSIEFDPEFTIIAPHPANIIFSTLSDSN